MSDIDKTIEEIKELNSKLEKNTNNLNLNKFERASANAIMPIIAELEKVKLFFDEAVNQRGGIRLAFDMEVRAKLKLEAELAKANDRLAELEKCLPASEKNRRLRAYRECEKANRNKEQTNDG